MFLKKKLLFLDHTPFWGGSQSSLVQQLKNIDKNKFEVYVVCSRAADKLGLSKEYEKAGAKYFYVGFVRLREINPRQLRAVCQNIRDLKRIICNKKIDLVISNTVRTAILGSMAAKLSGVNIVWIIRDFTFNKIVFKLLSVFAKTIMYNSKATADYYGLIKNNKERHEVIHNGSEAYKEVITSQQIKEKKESWGIKNNDTVVIGFVGRLAKWKGAQLLIEAIDLLIKQGIKNIKCVIVGTGQGQEGDNEKYLKNLVKEKAIGQYVFFTGYQADNYLCLAALDILCLTSLEPEPFGLVIIEAMMTKTLAIATNMGGPLEIIKAGETGFLIAKDKYSLFNVLRQVVNDKNLRNKIVAHAYTDVVNKFSIDRMIQRYEQVYLNSIHSK